MKIFLLIVGAWCAAGGQGYVLLQVRRGGNQSNVDALIHKVVPAAGAARAADTARKQFDHRRHSPNSLSKQAAKKSKGLESIVIAIDSGAAGTAGAGGVGGVGGAGGAGAAGPREPRAHAADRAVQRLAAALEEGAVRALPKYRAELEKYHIKPEIVHFRSGKPSVMFEISSRAVLRALQRLLASRELQQYADRVAGHAAALYRSVRDELLVD